MPDGSSAILAQLVEHITRNDEVVSSILTNGSSTNKGLPFDAVALFFYCLNCSMPFWHLLP
jgi:hypothetical protein